MIRWLDLGVRLGPKTSQAEFSGGYLFHRQPACRQASHAPERRSNCRTVYRHVSHPATGGGSEGSIEPRLRLADSDGQWPDIYKVKSKTQLTKCCFFLKGPDRTRSAQIGLVPPPRVRKGDETEVDFNQGARPAHRTTLNYVPKNPLASHPTPRCGIFPTTASPNSERSAKAFGMTCLKSGIFRDIGRSP